MGRACIARAPQDQLQHLQGTIPYVTRQSSCCQTVAVGRTWILKKAATLADLGRQARIEKPACGWPEPGQRFQSKLCPRRLGLSCGVLLQSVRMDRLQSESQVAYRSLVKALRLGTPGWARSHMFSVNDRLITHLWLGRVITMLCPVALHRSAALVGPQSQPG